MCRVVLLSLFVALTISACGSDSEVEPRETPGDADAEDVQVIDEWATALAGGDVDAAAAFFAIPSLAENGPILTVIEDVDDARRFNASLPCGAELIEAEADGEFTLATFRLIERPGPGTCDDGVGETAQTAFLIEDEEIVEWRRVLEDLTEPPGVQA